MNKHIFFVLTVIIFGCTTAQTSKEQSRLSAIEFSRKINTTKDAVIVDVRTLEEFEKGHLENAVNISWSSSEFDKLIVQLDRAKPVFVYCLSGGRSTAAATKMRNAGFENVIEMPGGMIEWRGHNLPEKVVKVAGPGMSLEEYRALLDSDKLVLVDFYAHWCVPCRKMEPYLNSIAAEMDDKVKVVRINTDENRALCKILDIRSLPVLQLYKAEELIWENTGYTAEKDIRAQLQ